MSGSPLILVAMGGWVPFVLLLFAFLPAPIAVISSYVTGWLFLPVVGYKLWDIFIYNKTTAVTVLTFLGVILFDLQRFGRLRFHWVDVPVILWCVSPFLSSFDNDLGAKDGLSESLTQIFTWGLPYLMGRMYFASQSGIQLLALGMFVGGVIYIPFCLYEVRMSPLLHHKVYGFLQHSWFQTMRGGGWRPMVFMEHGLMVSLWMATATLTGATLWLTGALKKLWGVPMWMVVGALAMTSVLCKSLGAMVLMGGGVGALLLSKRMRSPLPVYALMAVPLLYMGTRAYGIWDGKNLVDFVEHTMGKAQRADSLGFRFEAEDKLAAHALYRPLFGWGGWGRNFVKRFPEDPYSDEMVTVDGLWILHLGKNGWFGLLALTGSILLPAFALSRRVPIRRWTEPQYCYAAVLALALILYMIDNLFNAMVNPFYMLIAGGIVTFSQGATEAPRALRVFHPAHARANAEPEPAEAV